MDRASRIDKLKKLRRKEKADNSEDTQQDTDEKVSIIPLGNDIQTEKGVNEVENEKEGVSEVENEIEDVSETEEEVKPISKVQPVTRASEPTKEAINEKEEIEEGVISDEVPLPTKVTDDLRKDIQHYFDRLKALTEIEINNIIQKRYQESVN